jgi:hypothetical protein
MSILWPFVLLDLRCWLWNSNQIMSILWPFILLDLRCWLWNSNQIMSIYCGHLFCWIYVVGFLKWSSTINEKSLPKFGLYSYFVPWMIPQTFCWKTFEPNISRMGRHNRIKETVSRDFRPSVFFIKLYPWVPWFMG